MSGGGGHGGGGGGGEMPVVVLGNIIHGGKQRGDLRVHRANRKASGARIDSLFKRPLTLHTLL